MSETPRLVPAAQRVVLEGGQTYGMTREEAFALDGFWIGLVRTEPEMSSGWHHHGDHDSFIYVQSGSLRLEFGRAHDPIDAEPGDFVHIPKRTTHRESNPLQVESVLLVARTGSGDVVVNVEGPDEP